jgi:hypothetical protein
MLPKMFVFKTYGKWYAKESAPGVDTVFVDISKGYITGINVT